MIIAATSRGKGLMTMKYIALYAALGAAAVVLWGGAAAAEEDPVLAYSNGVQDVIAKFNAKLVEAQPFLVWPGDDIDQDQRDRIAWKLEVVINDLSRLKAEGMDSRAVPQGFDEAHKLISGAMELYITSLSRCGTGIQRNYVKTFNGGVQDYNNAGNYLDSGFDELSDALRRAGYQVN
jgi:hypothetical protein